MSCVTLWDQEQSHDPLLILIHVLIAFIAPLYSLAIPHLLKQMRPNILSRHTILPSPSSHHWHVRWEPSPVTCLRVISKWLNTFKKWPWFLPLAPRSSVVSRTAYQGSFTMSQWSQSRRSMIHDVMSSQLGSSRESNHVFCWPYFCIFLAIIIQWGLFIIRIDLFKIRPDSAQRSAWDLWH